MALGSEMDDACLLYTSGIEETVKWYLENQEWMDNVTSGDYQKYYDNMYSCTNSAKIPASSLPTP